MAPTSVITDNCAHPAWLETEEPEVPSALHLVLVWYPDEPRRVGQVAPIVQAGCLGREHPDVQGTPLLAFHEQRPGSLQLAPPLRAPSLSRRQLEVEPVGSEELFVRNVGRRGMLHNGAPVTEGRVVAGDTLTIEHTAVFLVERRPLAFPPSEAYPEGCAGAYGEPDRFGMVGESLVAWALRDALASAAAADAHLLLLGESGSGKEVAAAVVHGLSARRRGPFIARNAATMPETLLDAELFGTARNYPNTGSPERPGLIAEAHGGHLFLDEIGEMGEGHQAHLLRVLDGHGQYHRLGESVARRSDFRLVAATNRDPAALKHDLLARFPRSIVVPRLDERPSDIPLLIRALVARIVAHTPERIARFLDGGDPATFHLDPRLLCALLRHRYRLHVRELHRLLELALATSRGVRVDLTPEVAAELGVAARPSAPPGARSEPPGARSEPPGARSEPPGAPSVAPPALATEPPACAPTPAQMPVADERADGGAPPRVSNLTLVEVMWALHATQGNVSQAAARLGVTRYVLSRAVRLFGLDKGTTDSD